LDDWLQVASENQIGPQLLEDHAVREKIHSFDHERIPERVVHARGAAAFGTFKMHKSLEENTSSGVLTDTSRQTPVFLRFSTVLGSRGSADTVRDVRGFAVKFYTEEGNWVYSWEQHPGVLYPRQHEIPGSHPCWQTRAEH
jgi:catalase